MSDIAWKNLVGQDRIKDVLNAAFSKGTLGHAYLLCGDEGTGSFAAAIDLAMALLCQSDDNRPCGVCKSCHKVINHAHSDLHIIMPVCLQKEHKSGDGKLSTEGWNYLSTVVLDKMKNMYALPEYTGIPGIPVEWVREVNHAIIRGALEGGKNVAIIDGIDMMGKESANAMLKTLEEPPANTIMLLLTERLHAVLPTIVSRCQILRFGYLGPEIIREEVIKRCGLDPNDPKIDAVVDAGSLGAALNLVNNPVEALTQEAASLWNACVSKEWSLVAECVDRISIIDEQGSVERIFVQMIQLLRSSFLSGIPGVERKYFTNSSFPSLNLPARRNPDDLEIYVRICQDTVAAIRARGNTTLVLSNFAISIMENL